MEEAGAANFRVSIHFSETTSELELPAAMRSRILCHLLVSQIPDRGLGEALESLFEMWRFYREPVPRMIEPPRPQSLPAKLGATYDRPPFHIAED
ncbi:MAG TPA: hypothetical protein VKA15_00585 [Isosphaeraceae bacterium]|nr:hypothetical protein [Isosphaeraceae bacterium]